MGIQSRRADVVREGYRSGARKGIDRKAAKPPLLFVGVGLARPLGVFAFEGGDHWKRWQSIAAEVLRMESARGTRTYLSYVFRTPDLTKVPRASWTAATATLDQAKSHGFRIVDLTLDQVSEIHAARELYSNALQGNIDYSGPKTLAWLQARFAPFVKAIAFEQPPAAPSGGNGGEKEGGRKPAKLHIDRARCREAAARPRNGARAADRRYFGRSRPARGSEDLRDPLLRSVEAHPNLKAHPGPKTIFLQWRITRITASEAEVRRPRSGSGERSGSREKSPSTRTFAPAGTMRALERSIPQGGGEARQAG